MILGFFRWIARTWRTAMARGELVHGGGFVPPRHLFRKSPHVSYPADLMAFMRLNDYPLGRESEFPPKDFVWLTYESFPLSWNASFYIWHRDMPDQEQRLRYAKRVVRDAARRYCGCRLLRGDVVDKHGPDSRPVEWLYEETRGE